MSPPLRYLGAVLALAVAYVITGRLGLALAHHQVNATLVWPPTGLALGALILYGIRLWPAVFLGACGVNLLIGTPFAPALGIAIGNTLEAVAGTWFLVHGVKFDPRFSRVWDVVGFVVVGGLLASTVSASIGVGSLALFGVISGAQFSDTWLTWWLGDAGGAVVVAPMVLLAALGSPRWGDLLRRPEAWLLMVLLLLTSGLACFSLVGPRWMSQFVSNLVFPLVAWAGLRMGHRGAMLAIALVSLVTALGTSQGLGPFALDEEPARMLLLWAYLTSVAATALTLAVTDAEREAANRRRLDEERRGRRLEAQMQHSQRLESLGLLAGGVAHDFNNLLTAISGNAELLGMSTKDPEQRECVESILLASQRAAGLCRNLLSYSGKGVRVTEDVSLRAVVDPLPRLLKGVWPAEVKLDLDVPEGLQSVRGDFTELTQVVMNLVLNAGQAEGATEVWVCAGRQPFSAGDLAQAVTTHSLEPGTHTFVEVGDNGAGITDDVRARLFEPFYTTKETGRGLGLAAVLGIVRGHGGALVVDTSVGAGTRIKVVLPTSSADAAGVAAAAPTAAAQRAKQVILLADDEPAVLAVTARSLRNLGHEVVEARDGLEAMARFRSRRADVTLALLDVTMPRQGGVETLQKLREQRPELPVVLMSGYSAEAIDPQGLGVEFLAKPFPTEDLVTALSRATSRLLARQAEGA